MKVAVQKPALTTLIRITLMLAMTVSAVIFSLKWFSADLLPAIVTVLPIALLWGWAEYRLFRLKQSAQHRFEEMRMLTGSLAHDLRTPLCSAMNAVGNLREATHRHPDDPARVERAFAAAEKSLQRCHHLITAVLDYSRNGRHHLQPVWIDPWLEKMVSEFPLPTEIHLATHFQARAQVAAAPSQLRRAVHNLMENATQAMMATQAPRSGHRLELTSHVRRRRVEICVKDTGPGIPTEDRKRIFRPLFTGRKDGVGLGLAIAQDVARQHEGGLHLDSPSGEGACFRLTLPVK
ncbi:MAG: HAMP domain-containing sensor histidine kinase [Desulfosarcinaceae bacterium]|nr:HAMP domain-containing sensor histidine kinase [Desulfosarcinaceae bacterium]